MKKLFLITFLFITFLTYSQSAGLVTNNRAFRQSVEFPETLMGCETAPNALINVYYKDSLRWKSYQIIDLNDSIQSIGNTYFKNINYIPDWNEITNKPIIPTNNNQLINGAGYLTTINSSQVSSALGYIPYNGTLNPNGYISTYIETDPLFDTKFNLKTTSNLIEGSNLYFTNTRAQNSITLTTNGNSGNATYSGGILNIPNYSTTSSKTFNNNVSRSLNSNFTISSTKDSNVNYSINLSVTNPLLIGNSTASAFLEYSLDGGTTWITISQVVNSSSVALSVTIQITQPNTFILSGNIPANASVRIRTTTTGTSSASFIRGQEMLY